MRPAHGSSPKEVSSVRVWPVPQKTCLKTCLAGVEGEACIDLLNVVSGLPVARQCNFDTFSFLRTRADYILFYILAR